jgi:hypothetical protein
MLKYIYYRFCPINEKGKRSKKIDPNYDRMFFGVVLVALTPLMVFIFKITENLSHAKAISAIVYLIIVFIVERAIKNMLIKKHKGEYLLNPEFFFKGTLSNRSKIDLRFIVDPRQN